MLFGLVISVCVGGASALLNGVGRLPVLGYNAWNAFQCNVNEAIILETAQLMVSLGLKDAGYEFVDLDDCWASKSRDASGSLVPDPTKWPDGISGLSKKLAALGFKTGIYSDSGWFTCAGYPGSWGNELKDVQTFNEWGVSLLKYDNCAIPFDNITRQNELGRYEKMSNAIAQVAQDTGKEPLVFMLCEWGWQQVWLWGKQFGHSWRIDGDIAPTWATIAAIIDTSSFIATSTDFGGRNDMDMLQLGNGGLTFEESKSHFTAWALLKSPLLIGTNLSSITPDILSILTNKELIAINQDPSVGQSITPFRWGVNPDFVSNPNAPAEYWSGPTQTGVVFMILNNQDVPATMFFNLTESPWIRAGRQYAVRDLWAHEDKGLAVRNMTLENVAPHGVNAFLLTDAGNEPAGIFPQCAVWWQCTAQDGTRTGG